MNVIAVSYTHLGQGMWAASLRYHEGRFYICFVANDTRKTYLYTSEKIDGTWKKQLIEGFYNDAVKNKGEENKHENFFGGKMCIRDRIYSYHM